MPLVLPIIAAAVLASSTAAQSSTPLIVDGFVDDWSDGHTHIVDARGDASGPTDVTMLAGRRMGGHVYLRLVVADAENLHKPGPGGGLRITMTSDDQTVTVDTANRWAEVDGERVPWGAVNYVGLPTHGAAEYEIRVRVAGGDVTVTLDGSDTLDEPLVLEDTGETQPPRVVELDRGDTPLRVVVWNVLQGGPFGDPDRESQGRAVLAELDPDVLLLQEVWRDDDFDARVRDMMGDDWAVHELGGVAVASPFPLTLLDLGPDVELDNRRRPVGGDSWSVMRNLFVGVDTPVGPVVMVSSHWKCCGDTGSTEDLQRMDDVLVALKSIWRLRDAGEPASPRRDGSLPYKAEVPERFTDAPIVIAGDYNLVGSRAPLEMLLTQGFVDQVPVQSDEWIAGTWRSPRDEQIMLGEPVGEDARVGGFPQGRLDFALTDPRLDVSRTFVADMGELTLLSDHLPIVVDIEGIDGD